MNPGVMQPEPSAQLVAGIAMTEYLPLSVAETDPTLVLLPSLGLSRSSWAATASLLQKRYRCLALDPPGRGDSPLADHLMTIFDLASAVSNFIDALGLCRVVAIGNSMGATISAQLASDRPDVVVALGLVGSFVVDSETSRREWLHSRSASLLEPNGSLRAAPASFIEAVFGRYEPDWHRMVLEDHINGAAALASSFWALFG